MRTRIRLLPLAFALSLLACSDRSTGPVAPSAPSFIVNGVPTGSSFPSVGGLLFDFDANGVIDGNDLTCTGSLISPTVFLTAAHCVVDYPTPTPQFYVSFAPDLYASKIKLIKATGFAFDLAFGHDMADLHDLAVVFLPAGSTKGLTPLHLPPAGYLDQLNAQNGLKDATFVNVGYGTSATLTGEPAFPYNGLRNTSLAEFLSLQPSWLELSINSNATGLGGDCYGDSGGPKFLSTDLTTIVATVTTGDLPCRATSVDYRTDTQSARNFLRQFVTLP